MADGKIYYALLNGLSKRLFLSDNTITNEYLKSELYPDLDEASFEALSSTAEKILTNIVSNDMDFVKLERFLAAQVSKKSEHFGEEHSKAVLKFWKSQRSKIQDHLSQSTCWQNRLTEVGWRVDVKTKSRVLEELNTPVGLLELKIAEYDTKASSVVQVELDRDTLKNLLAEVSEIEKQLKTVSA